jgi:hypothetical protein
VIDMRTRRIVWQYGHTDRPGTRNGFLHTPDGLDLLPWRAASNLRALRRLLAPPSVRTHGVG